jgi:NurA-like 5'-3' nuclease
MEQTDGKRVCIRLAVDGMSFLCTARNGEDRLILESVQIAKQCDEVSAEDDDPIPGTPGTFPWSFSDLLGGQCE